MEKSVEPSDIAGKTATETPGQPSGHGARTPGLKLLDVFIYPILTNFSVFAISVVATYLTSKGGMRTADGSLRYGKAGEWFQNRGTWLANKFKSVGMSDAQADMSKMVAFSFIDGSIMAIPVKWLEDRREQIGRWMDDRLGTRPEDESVYAAEPKQTWLSVLGGRFLTASIVVPTAVALDKTGLNDTLFNSPGLRAGEWLAKQPTVKRIAGDHDVRELSRIGFFEAFYTSVCTLGLYISSRGIARVSHERKKEKAEAEAAPLPIAIDTSGSKPSDIEPDNRKPMAQDVLKKPRISETASFAQRYDHESTSTHAAMSV